MLRPIMVVTTLLHHATSCSTQLSRHYILYFHEIYFMVSHKPHLVSSYTLKALGMPTAIYRMSNSMYTCNSPGHLWVAVDLSRMPLQISSQCLDEGTWCTAPPLSARPWFLGPHLLGTGSLSPSAGTHSSGCMLSISGNSVRSKWPCEGLQMP